MTKKKPTAMRGISFAGNLIDMVEPILSLANGFSLYHFFKEGVNQPSPFLPHFQHWVYDDKSGVSPLLFVIDVFPEGRSGKVAAERLRAANCMDGLFLLICEFYASE